jgi:hypothetical protein
VDELNLVIAEDGETAADLQSVIDTLRQAIKTLEAPN